MVRGLPIADSRPKPARKPEAVPQPAPVRQPDADLRAELAAIKTEIGRMEPADAAPLVERIDRLIAAVERPRTVTMEVQRNAIGEITGATATLHKGAQ